ncbi:hypothetical protein T484DRAFT_1800045 [Baffinella frigidus]|nr:hypothetical protein T484DRAFT_1800045 [Cryptophyta sp. CCMP2293]
MVRWERRREFQAPGLALLGVALVFLPSSSSYIVAPPAMLRKSVGVSPVAPSALRFSGRLHEASGRQARMGGWRRETWGTLNLQAGYEGVEAELSGDNDDDTNPFGIEDDEGPRFDENDLMRLKVPDLKQLCDSYGVSKTGKKGDIIERLLQAQADELGMTVKVAPPPAPLPAAIPGQRSRPRRDDQAPGAGVGELTDKMMDEEAAEAMVRAATGRNAIRG